MADKLCLCIIEEGYKKRNVENIEEIEKRNMKKCRKKLDSKGYKVYNVMARQKEKQYTPKPRSVLISYKNSNL